MVRVKKNDTVVVIAGKDKGKRGTVLVVDPKKERVMVKGVAIVTRHAKARRAGETAGIRKQEAFIDLSNVMPLCRTCNKPSRVGVKDSDQAAKVRICVRCQEAL